MQDHDRVMSLCCIWLVKKKSEFLNHRNEEMFRDEINVMQTKQAITVPQQLTF